MTPPSSPLRTSPYWLATAGFFGLTAVAALAAGAHAASGALAHELILQAGNLQLFHALLLVTLASNSGRWIGYSRWLITLGILLFCGSLYTKAFLALEHAPLAPWGGSFLMLGWLMLIIEGIGKARKA